MVPFGVAVEAGEVNGAGHFIVVQPPEHLHQIRGNGQIRGQRPQGLRLRPDEIHGLVGDKALPGKVQPVNGFFADGRRTVQLVPVGEGFAPKAGPPGVVQGVQRAVTALQEFPEGTLAQLAVAFAAVFVGDVPAHHRRVLAEALGQCAVDPLNEFTVGGGGKAVVVTTSVEVAHSVRPHPQYLGVALAHPCRPCAAWRGQKHRNPGFVQPIQHFFQPVKGKPPILGLQRRPGEYAYTHQIAARQLHQAYVLLKYIGPVQPLVGVVVAAMSEKRKPEFSHNIVSCSVFWEKTEK